MEKLSNRLKAKRLETGLTIEEVSEKTRLTTKHIKALEEGDMEFFKDDLSYLRFFLRSYCDAVGFDFEEAKPLLHETIDSYTTAFSKKKLEEQEQIKKNIESKAKQIEKPRAQKQRPKRQKPSLLEKKRWDLSLVSLFAVIAVIAIGLVYAFFVYVLPGLSDDDPNPAPKQEQADTPIVDQKEEPKEEEETSKLAISKTDANHYVIENVQDQEELEIKIVFLSEAWFQLSKNATVMSEPQSKVYTTQESAAFKIVASANDAYTMRFGNWAGAHEISVNGVKVELDETILASKGPQNITLTIKGE